MEVKTSTGFKCKIDEDIKNDYRLLKAISNADSEDASLKIKGTTDLVSLIFGENESKLMEHIAKKNDGKIPVEAVTAELTDVLNSINELKN